VTRALPFTVAHLTTVDMSLELLLRRQLDAIVVAGAEVVGISAPGPWVTGLTAGGIRHVSLPASTRERSLRADLRAAAQLWRLLRAERPTVLHTHNPKPGLYGRVVGRLAGVPIVVNTVHGLYATDDDPLAKRLLVYGLEAVASRFSDAELVQNPEDVETIVRHHLAAVRKVHLLGNGIDLATFCPSSVRPARRTELRAAWGAAPDTIVLGAVGRLVAEKGYPELFDATEGLAGARLVVAGPEDPDKPDDLSGDVRMRAIRDGVQFLGHRDDMVDVYGAFDLFVLASRREGFPRAAMEAAAMGLPIVATDVRGCRQVVEHDVNGLLVPAGDASALRAALSRLVAEPATRHRMGLASIERAAQLFDDRAVCERVLASYRNIAARKGIELVRVSRASSGVHG
jgi:glycosyltransferase involved in cell wall biosynthesis